MKSALWRAIGATLLVSSTAHREEFTRGLGEFECMSAIIAAAKRLSFVIDAADQESALWDFKSTSAKNAPERESALVLPAAGQALFKLRHNQTDPLLAMVSPRRHCFSLCVA